MFRPLAPNPTKGTSDPNDRLVELERQIAALERENAHLKRSFNATDPPAVSLSPNQLLESQPKKRRRLIFDKCDQCRRDRQACRPQNRVWPDQKCDRCIEKDFPCSENSNVRARTTEKGNKVDSCKLTTVDTVESFSDHIAHVILERRGQQSSIASTPLKDSNGLDPVTAIKESLMLQERCRLLGELLLLGASDQGDLKAVQLLLDAGINVDARPTPNIRGEFMDKGSMKLAFSHDKYASAVLIWARIFAKADCIRAFNDSVDVQSLLDYLEPSRAFEYHQTALMVASGKGHTSLVELLLERGARFAYKGSDGQNALAIAAREGQLDIVGSLLDVDPFTFHCDFYGDNLVHLAVNSGNSAIVELLVPDCDIDQPNMSGVTPFHTAVTLGNEDITDMLIEADCDVNTTDRRGRRPIHEAAARGHVLILRQILKAGVDIEEADKDGRTPLLHAVLNDHFDAVQTLINLGANSNVVDTTGEALIVAAMKMKQAAIVELIHEAHVYTACFRDVIAALKRACDEASIKIVELLLQNYGLKKSSIGWALRAAIDAKKSNLTTDMATATNNLDLDLLRDEEGHTPLLRACMRGDAEVVEMLLSAGASTETPSPDGRTPLLIAITGHHCDVARVLIDHGANVNTQDAQGRPPLYWTLRWSRACDRENALIALTKAGADVNHCCIGKDGDEPQSMLWHAVDAWWPYAVAQLLRCEGIHCDGVDQGSSLRLAMDLGRLDIAMLLADWMFLHQDWATTTRTEVDDYVRWAKLSLSWRSNSVAAKNSQSFAARAYESLVERFESLMVTF